MTATLVTTAAAQSGWRELTDAERAHGYRLTDDGLIHGTPRTPDDPRFDTSTVPADAFAPHGAAVWAVLDRISWFTLADAQALSRAGTRIRGSYVRWDHAGDEYQVVAGARAAGGHRLADWRSIREIACHIRLSTAPPEAGIASRQYGPATGTWNHAFGLAVSAAEGFLVADRPELTESAYQWLTGPWLAAFPGTPTPARCRR